MMRLILAAGVVATVSACGAHPAPQTPSSAVPRTVATAVFTVPGGDFSCELTSAVRARGHATAWCSVPSGVRVPAAVVRACGPMDVDDLGFGVRPGRGPGWGCGTDVPVEPSRATTRWAGSSATWADLGSGRTPVLTRGRTLRAGDVSCTATRGGVTCRGPEGSFALTATRVSFHPR